MLRRGRSTTSDVSVLSYRLAQGPTYAAVDEFRIKIHGKQAHGAYPQLGVDPIVTAAQAFTIAT